MRVCPFAFRYQGNGATPANILIPLERQLITLQRCRWKFLYNETLRHTLRPLLSKLSKTRQTYVLYPHFEEVRGGVEPWLMVLSNACVDFLLSVVELLFSIFYGWGATRQNMSKLAALRRGYVTWSQDFRGEGSSPCQYFDTARKAIDCATILPLTVFI